VTRHRPHGPGWLRRRWWLFVVVPALVAALAFGASTLGGGEYRAEATLLVRTGASDLGPGNVGDANRLAVTYAEGLPQDRSLQDLVAERTGLDVDAVEEGLAATATGETAMFTLSFTDVDRARAVEVTRLAAQELARTPTVSAIVAPGSVNVARLPDQADPVGYGSTYALVVGAVFGLGLAALLALAWERADPRVDTADRLGELLGCPVTELDHPGSTMLAALGARWLALAGEGPARVVLVPVDRRVEVRCLELARSVAAAVGNHPPTNHTVTGSPGVDLQVIPVEPPGSTGAAEAAVVGGDLCVVVAAPDTTLAAVRRGMTRLEHFGARPSWALVVRNGSDPGHATGPVGPPARAHGGHTEEPPSADAGTQTASTVEVGTGRDR
jgi:capsular polysaccharide biosynthesis protein